MDFLRRMSQALDYIEAHLSDDMDMNDIAAIARLSAHQFGRIFSYVVGIPLSEYIRRRRLSQAAAELGRGGAKVIDVALKYGYDSPDAFGRAFLALHGITPRKACARGAKLKMYPRIAFHISIRGDVEMEYRIEEMGAIKGVGVVKNLGVWKVNSEAQHWTDKMGEVYLTWDAFLDHGMNEIIRDRYQLYRAPLWQFGATHTTDAGETVLYIGAEPREGESYPELTYFEIPASTWAVFTTKGTLNQDTHPVEKLMTRIATEWFPSSGYERLMNYDIEVYGPGTTQTDDYISEVWISVRKK